MLLERLGEPLERLGTALEQLGMALEGERCISPRFYTLRLRQRPLLMLRVGVATKL